jgi:uncharacterized protein
MDAETNQSRQSALGDLALVVGTLVAVKQSVLPFTIVYAGPVSTFSAMSVATFLLYRRGLNWADLGLRKPDSWWRTLGLCVVVFLAFVGAAAGFGAIADIFFEDVGASGRFDFVKGNLPGYLLIMALVWTHGSFFEELLFRAFVITKASTVLGGGRGATLAAVLLAAVFFGYRHYYYQGMHGALVTGGIGLVFGLIYIWFGKRNIWPLVLVHGLVNSISQTQRFLGA